MNKFCFILFFTLVLCISVNAQQDIAISPIIRDLNEMGAIIISNQDDEAKHTANDNFKNRLRSLIEIGGSFDMVLDSIKTISILKAGDLKIYNWALPLSDGTFEYYAFLQLRKGKEDFSIIELTDKSDDIKNPETKILTQNSWYGALYYKIIYDKKLGKSYYTLLGWDGNNNLTNKKIIDVINVGNSNMIKFGAPIFKTKGKAKRRIIFEYSENTVMSLKYHKNIQKIVFDFLVPASSKLEGVYEYYGPSLNRFDAFSMDKGKWNYEEDINIELDRSVKDFMWEDPKKN